MTARVHHLAGLEKSCMQLGLVIVAKSKLSAFHQSTLTMRGQTRKNRTLTVAHHSSETRVPPSPDTVGYLAPSTRQAPCMTGAGQPGMLTSCKPSCLNKHDKLALPIPKHRVACPTPLPQMPMQAVSSKINFNECKGSTRAATRHGQTERAQ